MPGFREILSFSGTCAATSKSMDYLLSTPKGRAVILVVGGAREVLCQDHDRIDLIILKRKGNPLIIPKSGFSKVSGYKSGAMNTFSLQLTHILCTVGLRPLLLRFRKIILPKSNC